MVAVPFVGQTLWIVDAAGQLDRGQRLLALAVAAISAEARTTASAAAGSSAVLRT